MAPSRNISQTIQLFAEKLTRDILAPVPHRHWTFTIPRVLRGLFERERTLLGLLSRTAYEAIRKSFQALFERSDVRPGCIVSLQTHGAFGCNFHPHCHAIVSDGVFTPQGEFLPLPSLDTSAILEVFRRLLLRRLRQAERLSENFMQNILSWVHPGFSVFAGPPLQPSQLQSLESQARYITRPAIAMDALKNSRMERSPCRHHPTHARAPPRSFWIRLNGFTALPLIFPIQANIPDALTAPIATGR